MRYKCGLLSTIQDVLHQRPGWVEVKESVGLCVYPVSFCSDFFLYVILNLFRTVMESGISTGVMLAGSGRILIIRTWRNM